MSRLAIYPGSFDPVTRGHLDIILRARRIFDHIIVAVLDNSSKRHAFSVDDRIRMLEGSLRNVPHVEVDTFSGLLVDYLKARKARVILRGLRVVSDLDYEFQLAAMNRRLCSEAETVFLMPDDQFTYLSSSIVRDIARMGSRDLDAFVTPVVSRRLRRKGKP